MIEIPQELTNPETVEMDFGDCMDFLVNNGSYLDLCWLKNHWRVTWIVNRRDYTGNDENIFKAVAQVVEKVRNGHLPKP